MFALMVEAHFSQGVRMDPHELAATAFTLATTQASYSTSFTPKNKPKIDMKLVLIDRCATYFAEFIDWMNRSGFTVIGCEVEVRSQTESGRDVAIKIDILATMDGEVFLLDIKTFGMWGVSVTASAITKEQLRQSLQVALYVYILERGGDIYIGGNIGRTETNKAVRARLNPIAGKIKPDHVGYINIAMLGRRKKTTKNGNAGEFFGSPLETIPYSPSMVEYAVESIDAVEILMTFKKFPRVQKFERGYSTCISCSFKQDCWGGRAAPGPTPKWLADRSTK